MAEDILRIENWFHQRVRLINDPYFEREFFTNLIHCMDRKKSLRELLEESLKVYKQTGQDSNEGDQALLHLFYAYQASQFVRESYQWLPLAQGLFTKALFRGDARKPLADIEVKESETAAVTLEDFLEMTKLEARRVSSYDKAWSGFRFLMQSRSSRAKAIGQVMKALFYEGDVLSTSLFMKAIDISFSTAWKQTSLMTYRAFQRFWEEGKDLEVSPYFQKAVGLTKAQEFKTAQERPLEWQPEWDEEIWEAFSKQSAEAAWEKMTELSLRGMTVDQALTCFDLIRGRCLFQMDEEQWPLMTQSLLYGDAIRSAIRWSPDQASLFLAMSLADLSRVTQQISVRETQRPNGTAIMAGFSLNLSKNQLLLRLDDACERGDATEALALLAVILKEKGLAHSVSDRLIMMASKQDGWTYEMSSIPVAMILCNAYQEAERLKIQGHLAKDGLFGLLRFMSDQRRLSIQQVIETGHYNDGGLYKSPFDVSNGARIVDRFVFNQMRNAQRVQIWPGEAKG